MIAAQYKLSVLWAKMNSWMQSIERTLCIVNAVGTNRLDTSIQRSVFLRQRNIGVALNSTLRCAGVLSFYNNHLCCFCFTYFVCRFSVGKDCSIFSCFCCVTFHTFSSSDLPRIDSCLEHAPSLNILKDEILLKMPNVDEDMVDCRSRRKSSKRMHFSGNKNICFLFGFPTGGRDTAKIV